MPFRFFSQDTVFLKSGFKLIVCVKEVNAKEIKYIKCNKPKGFSFFEDAKNIKFIHYLNGHIDTIKVALPEPIFVAINDNKLHVSNLSMKYNSKKLKDKELLSLFSLYPAENIKNELLNDFNAMKRLKRKRITCDILTWTLGFLTLESPIFLWAGFGPRPPIAYIIPATLAVSCGTSIVFSIKRHKKEALKKEKISILYNEGL